MVDPQGQQCFHLRQNSPRPVRRIRTVSADSPRGEKRFQRDRRLRKKARSTRWRIFPAATHFRRFICYEAIYPGEIRHFAANGAQLFVNISNDGWFGHSAAAEQHLLIRAYALSKIADGCCASPTAASPRRSIRTGEFSARCRSMCARPSICRTTFRTDETIYTRYGDWFAWLCVIVSAILLATTFRKGTIAGEGIAIPVGSTEPAMTPAPGVLNFRLLRKCQTGITEKTRAAPPPMILEDFQYRYEALKPRITLVRSFL